MALLDVSGLSAGYGESKIVQDIAITVGEREVVCLLGANGAGKTTTMAVLAGSLRAQAGQARYGGIDLLALKPHQRVASGLVLCPEGRKVFPTMSVEENLLLGSYHRAARAHRAARLAEMFGLFPILAERRRQDAGTLSGGEQQMLALARALMAGPRMLLLDEPSLGLAPRIVLQLYELIARIAASRIAILLVEQNTQAALSVAARGYVMAAGRIVLQDDAAGLSADPKRLQAAFLGSLDA
jgi:branched-chain amino acid transport system ATP-binding protein